MAELRGGDVTDALEQLLQGIQPGAGYGTALSGVFRGCEKVKDTQPKPYVLLRTLTDVRTGKAGGQTTRLRTFELEVVFSHAASDRELDQAHADICAALGYGEPDYDNRFPGLVDGDEQAAYAYPAEGSKLRAVIVQLGVTYVQRYPGKH